MDLPCIIRIQFLPRGETISECPVSTAGGGQLVERLEHVRVGQIPRLVATVKHRATIALGKDAAVLIGLDAIRELGELRSNPIAHTARHPATPARHPKRTTWSHPSRDQRKTGARVLADFCPEPERTRRHRRAAGATVLSRRFARAGSARNAEFPSRGKAPRTCRASLGARGAARLDRPSRARAGQRSVRRARSRGR